MDFNKQMPDWKNKGDEPSDELKTTGFQLGDKPPASIYNWFWSLVTDAISEIQQKLASHTHNKSEINGLNDLIVGSDGKVTVSYAEYAWNANKLNGKYYENFVNVNVYGKDADLNNPSFDKAYIAYSNSEAVVPNKTDADYWHIMFFPYAKYGTQIAIPFSSNKMYVRSANNNSWSDWKLTSDGGNADTLDGKHADELQNFNNLTNKPSINSAVKETSVAMNGSTVDTLSGKGNYSVAMNDGIVGGDYSVAMNEGVANGELSTAMNNGKANGKNSTAIGGTTHGNAQYSVAMNNGTTGVSETTDKTANYSVAMNKGHALGDYSVAMNDGVAEAIFSTALCCGTTGAAAYYSVAMNTATANGDYSVAMNTATANGTESVAMGYESQANGSYSVAMGYESQANGTYSVAMGCSTVANSYQTAAGKYNTDTTAPTSESDTSGSVFIVGTGTASTRKNSFRVSMDGNCYGANSFKASGADFAEYFEWQDGNPYDKDRRGLFVTVVGEKIKIATADDDIIGVVSATPTITGDTQSENWKNLYLTDVFGEPLKEVVTIPESIDEKTGKIIPEHTETHLILNPDYNPDKEYISRDKRKEWAAVGIVGKLIVVDDSTCEVNGYCRSNDFGQATKSDNGGYRVLSRIDDNHIKILLK